MERKKLVRVLAISGSLRRSSSNTALLAAAVRLAPSDVDIALFRGLAELPPFNPDVDQAGVPESVNEFRTQLHACDAVLISSPEYAHGVPGVLKNALDWIVGSGELVGKPVGLLNASARATLAWTSLVETLTVMSARLVPDASITIPLYGSSLNATNIAADVALATSLRQATQALATAAREASSRPQDETREVP